MSYSFSVRGTTEAEVMKKVDAELAKVVLAQPIHEADRMQVRAAAMAFVNIIPDPSDKQDFCLSVSGSVAWTDGNVITGASVNVSASLIAKEAP